MFRGIKREYSGMEEATIEDLAFEVSSAQWSQKHAVFAPAKKIFD